MNRLFNWLKRSLDTSPILFVLIAGPVAYGIPLALFFGFYSYGLKDAYVVLLFVPVTVVAFNWFVARYEKRSWVAQVIAVIPAMTFIFLSIVAGLTMGERVITCMPDSETGEVRCWDD